MVTLKTSPEANSDRRTDRQAGRMTKPLIGARATALPKNIVSKLGLSRAATHYNFKLGLIKLNESSESN